MRSNRISRCRLRTIERQGMNPDEARYAALRKFGGVDQVKEKYRDRRGLPFVETFLRDLSYGGSHVAAQSDCYHRCNTFAGTRHWCEHGFIQRSRRCTPENFAGRSAGSLSWSSNGNRGVLSERLE